MLNMPGTMGGAKIVFKNQLSYLVIFLISQLIAVAFSHFTQRHYVWRSTKKYKNELVKFSASYVVVSILNLVLLAIAVDLLAWSVLFSQYSIGLALIVGNYFSQKYWVFRNSS
jgi:putative flippase GtrA